MNHKQNHETQAKLSLSGVVVKPSVFLNNVKFDNKQQNYESEAKLSITNLVEKPSVSLTNAIDETCKH